MALPRGRSIIPEGRSFFLHLGAASYSSQACASVRAHQSGEWAMACAVAVLVPAPWQKSSI